MYHSWWDIWCLVVGPRDGALSNRYSGVTWSSWRLISPPTRHFVQELVQTNGKEKIKASHWWPFERESIGYRGIPHHKGLVMRKSFPCHYGSRNTLVLQTMQNTCSNTLITFMYISLCYVINSILWSILPACHQCVEAAITYKNMRWLVTRVKSAWSRVN